MTPTPDTTLPWTGPPMRQFRWRNPQPDVGAVKWRGLMHMPELVGRAIREGATPSLVFGGCRSCGLPLEMHGLTFAEPRFKVCPGDWIVKHSDGEIEVLTDATFNEFYEIVEDEA